MVKNCDFCFNDQNVNRHFVYLAENSNLLITEQMTLKLFLIKKILNRNIVHIKIEKIIVKLNRDHAPLSQIVTPYGSRQSELKCGLTILRLKGLKFYIKNRPYLKIFLIRVNKAGFFLVCHTLIRYGNIFNWMERNGKYTKTLPNLKCT